MTDVRSAGVVVDTMVISWLLDERPNAVADRYRALIGARPVLLAFQTVIGAALRECAPDGRNCVATDRNGESLS